MPETGRTFYYASSYHLPGVPGGGARTAELAIPELERLFSAKCTSKWPFDFRHGEPWFAEQAAKTDMESVKRADFVVFAPLTKTSRGTHVELGMALALRIPVLGFRFADGDDGTAFDALCDGPLRPDEVEVIRKAMAQAISEHKGPPGTPAPMPKVG